MNTASPLRYPGGKAALSGLLGDIRRLNKLGATAIAEPFAGGAGASLKLLYLEETHEIHINDADPSIHDFWFTVVKRPKPFLEMLRDSRPSISEWHRQRLIYGAKGRVSRLRRGFAAFYLNRCNHSGVIMNGGPIGGIRQKGKWKIGARYNRKSLIERCMRLAEYGDRISVTCLDGLGLIRKLKDKHVFFFIDPPYFAKGPQLYLNGLSATYHEKLASCLRSMKTHPWVLTYDDCPEIRSMYKGWARITPFSIRYSAAERRPGKEIMITPRWMLLPTEQVSKAVAW
jgi:DNA adenine methylase